MTFKDQLNREIHLPKKPKRIVSLVPSQTELLVDLGLIDSIVGITKFCVHPKELRKQKEVVGGTKQVKVDKIAELKPDIILCNKEENSLEIIQNLRTIAPIHISDIYNLEDCFELIEMYGELFEVQNKAEDIVNDIRQERESYKTKYTAQAKHKVAYFIWKEPWMVAASNTFINTMLKEANFENVFESEKRYPELSLSHPKLVEADAILLSSEPYPFKEKHIEELQSIFPKKTIITVDGELFSWHGSRIKYSYQYFSKLSI
ncbi:MAG: cobalamin-binding protein [Winogradskyella sp.]|uniref:ABC transporter substrate-binding protein n=1 Tax=Winogradskyella sp. TaxID=1883156 RepID=UPI000F3FE38B|nr:helical backbone metal receptor [Winogradskyella sp.]RNC86737.1 MAG: cobalamin-binding protein [Winogradskyella sp.]